MLAVNDVLKVDGTDPPAYLVSGRNGPSRLMLIDANGGLTAIVGGPENLWQVSVCPGSRRLIEWNGDRIVVRSTSDLSTIRSIGLSGLLDTDLLTSVYCRDSEGETIWATTSESIEDYGHTFRLFNVDDAETTIASGTGDRVNIGIDFGVVVDESNGDITRFSLKTGNHFPFVSQDQWSGRSYSTAAIDPSGTRVMVQRLTTGAESVSRFLLYDLDTGEPLWETSVPRFVEEGSWLDATGFTAFAYPANIDDRDVYLGLDTKSQEMSESYFQLGFRPLRTPALIAGTTDGYLATTDLAGDNRTELRLLPSAQHTLAAVLPISAYTPPSTTTSTSTTSTTIATPLPQPSTDDGVSQEAAAQATNRQANTTPTLLIVVATLGLLAVLTAIALKLRSNRTPK